MRNLILILLFFTCSTFLQAQDNRNQIQDMVDGANFSKIVRGDARKKYLENPYDQYLFQTFVNGDLFLKDGKTVTNGLYNYNILTDEVQFLLKEDTLTFVDPLKIHYAKFSDKVLTYSYYTLANDIYTGFFEVLAQGKYQLLYRRTALYVEAKPAKTGYEEDQDPYFKFINQYYIMKEKEVAFKVENKKELIKYFEGEDIDVKAMMKADKIKFNKEKDLARLFDQINKK